MWDPPMAVLGLRDQILLKNSNSNVKTPHFVGVEHIACERVIGLSSLNFVNVNLAVEIYPWFANHGIL